MKNLSKVFQYSKNIKISKNSQFNHLKFCSFHSDALDKKNNYYFPEQILIFDQGKMSIIDSKQSKRLTSLLNRLKIFRNSRNLFGLSTLVAVCFGYYTVSYLTGILTYILFRFSVNYYKNLSNFILELNLLENGKEVEIKTINKVFIVDIKNIYKLPPSILSKLKNNNKNSSNSLKPILINDGGHSDYYYIAPDIDYRNRQEIFTAIINNCYIYCINKIKSENVLKIN